MMSIRIPPTGTTTSYLRFPIIIHDERELTVYTPQGRLIFHGRASLSTARSLIRGYRRED